MATIWGIHNDHPQLHIEDLGIVTIGWDEVGDLSQLGQDREAINDGNSNLHININWKISYLTAVGIWLIWGG